MTFLRSSTIRGRLFRILMLAIAVVVVVIVTVWRFSVEPALRRAVGRVQHEAALRVADQIDHFIEDRLTELMTTTEVARLGTADALAQREALSHLLRLSPAIQEVSFAGRHGRESVRLSRTRLFTAAELRTLAGAVSFQAAMAGRPFLGPVYHPSPAEPTMTIAVPARFAAQDIGGVLTAEISLKSLWSSLAPVRGGGAGYAFVVDQSGTLIAHRDSSKVLMGTDFSTHPVVVAAREGRTGLDGLGGVASWSDGRESIPSFAHVSRLRWTVVVEEPVATTLAGVRRAERFGIALLVVTVVGAFAMSYWFSERIARPVRELREGAERLSQGDLEYEVQVLTRDEVGALAAALNTMAARLRASHAALQAQIVDKNRDLAALYALTTPIHQAGTIDRVVPDALERILDIVDADAGVARFLDAEGRCTMVSALGLSEECRRGMQVSPPAGGLVQQTVESGQVLIVGDMASDRGVGRGLLRDHGFRSAAYLPLKSSGTVYGVLTLVAREPYCWDERQRELFTAIAYQITVALENVRLYDEVQRALCEVKAKNAELDSFVYSVSHDLKAPLVTMQGMAGLFLEDYGATLDSRGQRYLTRLQANVQQMEHLISDLLALSRIGREARPPEPIDLVQVVDDLTVELVGLVQSRSAKITVRQTATLWGIRTQVEQVLGNLVSNAIKYAGSAEPPTVEIGATESGAWVECYVRDNGIGIDPAHHDKIFEAFQRLKDVEAEGTGVGLAIVKKIIDGAGGRVWVESARGVGATFHFTWPATPRPQ